MAKAHMALRKIECELIKQSENAYAKKLNKADNDIDMISSLDRTIGYMDIDDRESIALYVEGIRKFLSKKNLMTGVQFAQHYANEEDKWVDELAHWLEIGKDDERVHHLLRVLHEKFVFLTTCIQPSIYKPHSNRYSVKNRYTVKSNMNNISDEEDNEVLIFFS